MFGQVFQKVCFDVNPHFQQDEKNIVPAGLLSPISAKRARHFVERTELNISLGNEQAVFQDERHRIYAILAIPVVDVVQVGVDFCSTLCKFGAAFNFFGFLSGKEFYLEFTFYKNFIVGRRVEHVNPNYIFTGYVTNFFFAVSSEQANIGFVNAEHHHNESVACYATGKNTEKGCKILLSCKHTRSI